ncbi:MAG: 4Fe-4S dicluster domain-containing protein [Elusimicrobiota bacterium]
MLSEMKSKKIYCDVSKCLGCKSCEIACAVEHSKSKTLFQAINETPLPEKRVSVEYLDLPSSIFFATGESTRHLPSSLPLRCRHCEEALCISACMSGAMYKAPDGSTQHNEEKCVGCWMCIMVCPFGAISRKEKLALKCDLCKDRDKGPACVDACPTKSLIIK